MVPLRLEVAKGPLHGHLFQKVTRPELSTNGYPKLQVARARIGALDSEQWHSNTGNLGGGSDAKY